MDDLPTLRLASLQLSPERLETFVVYQRTLVEALVAEGPTEWSGKYAFAHAKALAASKIDLLELGKLKSMVGDFCGRRSAALALKSRAERPSEGPSDDQRAEQARREIPRLEDLSNFEARYGHLASALLVAREAELLALHRALAKWEGTGHVHPG
jgi:hypothetical protein